MIKLRVSKKTLINETIGPTYYNTALSAQGTNDFGYDRFRIKRSRQKKIRKNLIPETD